MTLQVVGAGLPRTGTSSLREALELLLGAPCYHMSQIPGHPFNLGEDWDRAISGGTPDWDQLLEGYVATADWPASIFWRELSEANPDALVLLSVRNSADEWYQSLESNILPHARMPLDPGWRDGRGITKLLERFAGTQNWDDPDTMKAAYERHNEEVRQTISRNRLLEWRATEGWEPICSALGLSVPDQPFPWNRSRG